MNELYVVDVYETAPGKWCLRTRNLNGTNLVARQTLHAIAELALKVIHDEAVVPHLIYLRLLFSSNLHGKLLKFSLPLRRRGDIWFRQHPVEIFVQAIQQ